ncbi:putative phage tail fibre protein [Serratia marcescens subsp. marcescens Db11]|uniref:Phage tail fibre protein n=1 Tax=Serratia marcescens subsp. marcescens Db11 TaxID=273526 RepID=A0ABC9IK45_SERMA|nr:tail fiber assembly protein [Serratia marcescens]CDG13155.1 putative phage tail fibre protein [Serratia marcescens subsp. marcescens Db11]
MSYFYSAITGGFYNDLLIDEYGDKWPEDAILVSDDIYDELMKASCSKKIIVANEGGYPIAVDIPSSTKEQLAKENARKISDLMTKANNDISRIQDAIEYDGGTDRERATLILLKQYRVILGRVDVSLDGKLNLPEYPS